MKKVPFLIFLAGFFYLSHVAEAGVVSGKISFTGTAQAARKIDMGADPVCAGSGENIQTEDVVVNSNATLKNVFVYVKDGLSGKTFETPKTSVALDQKGCHYAPHVLGIQVNQPLDIVNSDSTLHNVHGIPTQSKEFNLGMPIQGMKLSRKFDKPEVMVKFKCDVHPWMHAYIGVVDHPFFGVTNDQGSFEIKDLPPGKYTLEAWHEKYGTQTKEITVDESGSQSVDFSFSG